MLDGCEVAGSPRPCLRSCSSPALGAATLGAFATRDVRLIRTAMAACAVCDGTDFVATLAARRRLPAAPALFTAATAGASTAVAIAALAFLRTPRRAAPAGRGYDHPYAPGPDQ